MPKRATLSANAKRQRVVAAKVVRSQRASAIQKATGRVSAKATIEKPSARGKNSTR